MSITTITSREFNQDVTKAKRAAANGPVIITDRGQAAHVLLTMSDYQQLTDSNDNLIDLLAMPEVANIEFDPPVMSDDSFKAADFS